jgi:hypothetical protein
MKHARRERPGGVNNTIGKQNYGDMTSISAERIFGPGSFLAVKTGGIIWIAYDPTLDFHS